MDYIRKSGPESRIWLVSGDRQVGKTSLCQAWVDLARQAGWKTAGVLSKAVFDGDIKTAIDAQDLRSGERRRLASKSIGSCEGPRLGPWQFCAAALAWADECLKNGSPCDLLVVDELGPLEFERRQGWQSGIAIVTEGEYNTALVVVRPECLEQARDLWPAARIIRIEA